MSLVLSLADGTREVINITMLGQGRLEHHVPPYILSDVSACNTSMRCSWLQNYLKFGISRTQDKVQDSTCKHVNIGCEYTVLQCIVLYHGMHLPSDERFSTVVATFRNSSGVEMSN
jgi:hypothetical protein